MDLFSAMKQRKSTRAYMNKPVGRKDIEEIIAYAGMAPSAINLQPWEFIVTYGEEKDRLVRRLIKTHTEKQVQCGPGTDQPLPQKYTKRSKNANKLLEPVIALSGKSFNKFVEEGSCSFYGAPVAIIIVIDKIFPKLRYLDIGLSISYLLLAAEAKGLGTCPIGLIIAYADEIADALNISPDKDIILGLALGYPDERTPVNQVKTQREELSEILMWYE
jgi:nitroreductase